MIVYSDRRYPAETSAVLRRTYAAAADLIARGVTVDRVTSLLIDVGVLESALADAIAQDSAEEDPRIQALLRSATMNAGRAFCSSSRGFDSTHHVRAVVTDIERLARVQLPATVEQGLPEGYAFYALYPECYRRAASQFAVEQCPRRVECIGIRGIGSSLCAVVAAELERHGARVTSFTVRPHGHPFSREVRLDKSQQQRIANSRGTYFAIIDEGPGLSGSSFAGVAARLHGLGVGPQRIVLFPSWKASAEWLRSQEGRDTWQQHHHYVVEFDEIARDMLGMGVRDIGAGGWRELMYAADEPRPAVQPQHERRKYVRTSDNAFLKFAGLGRYGADTHARAERLAAHGWCPEPIGLTDGFRADKRAPGRPLRADDLDALLLDQIAGYCTFVSRAFRVQGNYTAPSLAALIDENASELIGDRGSEGLSRLRNHARFVPEAQVCAVDGHMAPHEWLRDGTSVLKTDALEHHDDHFYPGCQDIAWDLAGASVEFHMPKQAERYMLERYAVKSGDTHVFRRAPYYKIAYLAFRAGYATMAHETLGDTDDARRFGTLADSYSARLEQELTRA